VLRDLSTLAVLYRIEGKRGETSHADQDTIHKFESRLPISPSADGVSFIEGLARDDGMPVALSGLTHLDGSFGEVHVRHHLDLSEGSGVPYPP
jgi:hypothetical protein